MNHFTRIDGHLHIEARSLAGLASEFGTPLFAYSRSAIESAWHEFAEVLADRKHLICYAVKANSNLAVLDTLARLGSGFDIVSIGELERVLVAGGRADRIVFSGVGKQRAEMQRALEVGIRCFNVESSSELEHLSAVARAHGVVAPVSLRINPDVDARTHPYISTGLKENKFGIGMRDALAIYRRAAELPSLRIEGIDCHIGSQLTDVEPYADAVSRLVQLVDALKAEDIDIRHIDVGGGQGIPYSLEQPILSVADWARCVIDAIGERELEIIVEPGRYIVGPSGVLLTRVEYLKSNEGRHFAVVDAAMNDLIRPALYSAWQAIEAVAPSAAEVLTYDVVGPICESTDFLGKDRMLAIEEGDLLAVMSSGAYGAVMSSNYNTRPRAPEILVDGEQAHLARRREGVAELYALESCLPEESRATNK